MDSVGGLQECIYNYLVLHTEMPKTISELYNSLDAHINNARDTTYNEMEERERKAIFMESCYNLDRKYNNIHILFESYVPLLVHSAKDYECILKQHSDLQITCASNGFTVRQLIKLILNNPSKFHLNDNLLKYIIFIDEGKFKKIFVQFNLEVDTKIGNCTLLEWAEEYSSIKIVKYLTKYKYKKQINCLSDKLGNVISQNAVLKSENAYLRLQSHYPRPQVNPRPNFSEILLASSVIFLVASITYRALITN